MKFLISLFLMAAMGAGNGTGFAQIQTDEITTFILVRHAEKADDSRDPELSGDGYLRVEQLAEMLEFVQPDAVYSTPYIRTRETVRPVAEKNGLEIKTYNPGNPDAVAAGWIEEYQGKTVLVSGHSNTTPFVANALLGRAHFGEKFDESDYGNLLIITVAGGGERKLLHLRY